jgi:hypothetical protein
VLGTCHFSAALGAGSTCQNAFIHAADLLAISRAGFADFGADFAKTMLKMRAAELEIGRRLANFGAVHHKTEVICFNVLSASFKAVVHGRLQANLMAMTTSFYTGLHGFFSVGWVIHGILLNVNKQSMTKMSKSYRPRVRFYDEIRSRINLGFNCNHKTSASRCDNAHNLLLNLSTS